MAEKFIIEGAKSLSGEIEVRGAKNAAGPILAAALMTNEDCIIGNIPLVEDVLDLIKIIESMGAKVEWLEKRKIKISHQSDIDVTKMDFNKAAKIRISVLLIGSLLSRSKNFKAVKPGGDKIGLRPISTHISALEELGVQFEEENSFHHIRYNELIGKDVLLKEFSVTATENLIMAACLAKGKTIIRGAAAEPHVKDLCDMLNKMGARILGSGTHSLTIEGIDKLNGVEYDIIADCNEAGTFIIAGAVTPGKVKVKNLIPEHLDVFLDKLKEMGARFEIGEDFVLVDYSENLNPVKVQALPYPGFPTDLLPPLVPLLTQAKGKSLIHDPLYENRMNYINELRKMGADIELVDPHRAIIFGKTELFGQNIESWDIRAGASLVIAGLMAKGQTNINNIYQIDRGYEKIEERLSALGVDIKRVSI